MFPVGFPLAASHPTREGANRDFLAASFRRPVMYFPNTNRSLSLLFLVIALIGCGALIAFSGATAVTAKLPTTGGPVRLRLKVDRTTLGSNQATKMWAEFLDGDYN